MEDTYTVPPPPAHSKDLSCDKAGIALLFTLSRKGTDEGSVNDLTNITYVQGHKKSHLFPVRTTPDLFHKPKQCLNLCINLFISRSVSYYYGTEYDMAPKTSANFSYLPGIFRDGMQNSSLSKQISGLERSVRKLSYTT